MISRRKFLQIAGSAAVFSAVAGTGGYMFFNQPKFGDGITESDMKDILTSPYYSDREFKNIEPIIQTTSNDSNFLLSMKDILFPKKGILIPAVPLPSEKTNLYTLNPTQNSIIWMGHSTTYLQTDGMKILIDPVFSDYASPVSFINRAFLGSNIYNADDIPELDLLIISHDHWDHLDYATVMALKNKIHHIVCPLGVSSYFTAWGFDREKINAADWYENIRLNDNLIIHLVPSRHFSGRLFKRNQTQWAGIAIITTKHKIFYSGDGGYGKHFKEIGKIFGQFDLAVMENGQYNKSWKFVHMNPEESSQASIDINSKAVLPVHCGKFCLSNHSWQEPFERAVIASKNKNYRLLTPKIGEAAYFDDTSQQFSYWWKAL